MRERAEFHSRHRALRRTEPEDMQLTRSMGPRAKGKVCGADTLSISETQLEGASELKQTALHTPEPALVSSSWCVGCPPDAANREQKNFEPRLLGSTACSLTPGSRVKQEDDYPGNGRADS